MGKKNKRSVVEEMMLDVSFKSDIKPSLRDVVVLILSSFTINIFSLTIPLITLQIYDRILVHESIGTLQVLCVAGISIVLLEIMLKLCRSSLIGWLSARFEHATFVKSLKHLMETKLSFLEQNSTGEQLHNLTAVMRLKSFYSGQLFINLIDFPFIFIFLGFIVYLSGWLVILPILLLFLFGAYTLYLGQLMKTTLKMRDVDDQGKIGFLSEALNHIHTIKMLGLESAMQRRHEFIHGKTIHESYLLNLQNAQGLNAASFFSQIMIVMMVSVGSIMVIEGQITMGVLIACILLSGRIMQPVQKALSSWLSFQYYKLAKNKIEKIFSLPIQSKISSDSLLKPKGKIEIKNMSFSYDGKNTLFMDLNLKVMPGKSIAIVGESGKGKTTLLKLIAGFYEPNVGSILVDDMSVTSIPYDSLTNYIGYLPSNFDIFEGTIMENLTNFRPDFEERALEMSRYLGIDSIVSKLSAGYQTKLFDGPADPITPGVKQRITIARVLVNKPRIILFDHADKALDKDGYNYVFKLLGQLKGKATLVLVSNDRNILHLAQEEYLVKDKKAEFIESGKEQSRNIVHILRELN